MSATWPPKTLAEESTAFAEAVNNAMRARGGRRLDASRVTSDTINRFVRGQSLVEADAEMDQLLRLKGTDVVAYYRLPADVRERVADYAALKTPEDVA